MAGLESTWETRDLLVLEAAVKFLDDSAGRESPQGFDLAAMTGLSDEDVERALIALDGTYMEVSMTFGEARNWGVPKVYPEARRAVGQWPTPESVADRLVAAMSRASDAASNEEDRSFLRKAAAWFGGAGRDLLVEVAATAVTRGAGLSTATAVGP